MVSKESKRARSTERKRESKAEKGDVRTKWSMNFAIVFNRCMQDVCARKKKRERHTHSHSHRKVREKVQAKENKRFERDCQNVAGGKVIGEVERSQT